MRAKRSTAMRAENRCAKMLRSLKMIALGKVTEATKAFELGEFDGRIVGGQQKLQKTN